MRQDRRIMPVQSDIGRRSAVEAATPARMGSPGRDHYYMRRMKEILQVPVPVSPSPSNSALSSTVESRYSTNGNSNPPAGVLVHVGPPSLPVRLLDHVYMGSQRNADDVKLLKRYGITHVLNCAGLRRYDFTRSPYPKEAGIKGFLMISAEDHEDFDIMCHFDEAIAFLDDVRKSRGRALVHCNLGVNRSGAVAAAYLMVSEHRTLLDVIAYLKSKRFVVLSNKGFRRQLVLFARERGLLDPVEPSSDTATTDHGQRSTHSKIDPVVKPSPDSSPRRPRGLGSIRSAPLLIVESCPSVATSGNQSASIGVGKTKSDATTSTSFGSRSTGSTSDASSSSVNAEQAVTSSSRNFLSPVYESPTSASAADDRHDDGASAAAEAAVAAGDSMSSSVSSLTSASSFRSSTVFGGFLTMLGSRKPFRSTSFSNVSSNCSGSTTSIGASSSQGFGSAGVQSATQGGSTASAAGQQALSTSRPLRVYTRSSTDTELYRPTGGAGRPASATRHHFVSGRYD